LGKFWFAGFGSIAKELPARREGRRGMRVEGLSIDWEVRVGGRKRKVETRRKEEGEIEGDGQDQSKAGQNPSVLCFSCKSGARVSKFSFCMNINVVRVLVVILGSRPTDGARVDAVGQNRALAGQNRALAGQNTPSLFFLRFSFSWGRGSIYTISL